MTGRERERDCVFLRGGVKRHVLQFTFLQSVTHMCICGLAGLRYQPTKTHSSLIKKQHGRSRVVSVHAYHFCSAIVYFLQHHARMSLPRGNLQPRLYRYIMLWGIQAYNMANVQSIPCWATLPGTNPFARSTNTHGFHKEKTRFSCDKIQQGR